jgi:hypothetical protein
MVCTCLVTLYTILQGFKTIDTPPTHISHGQNNEKCTLWMSKKGVFGHFGYMNNMKTMKMVRVIGLIPHLIYPNLRNDRLLVGEDQIPTATWRLSRYRIFVWFCHFSDGNMRILIQNHSQTIPQSWPKVWRHVLSCGGVWGTLWASV